jgi:hypothetical protein
MKLKVFNHTTNEMQEFDSFDDFMYWFNEGDEHNTIKEVIEDKNKYEEGFNVLMEYWDSLPDEEKADIDKRLKGFGI